jgi:hypothetical protein
MNALPSGRVHFTDEEVRQAAWIRFKVFAYQWY